MQHVGKGTKKSVMTPEKHDGNKLCMLQILLPHSQTPLLLNWREEESENCFLEREILCKTDSINIGIFFYYCLITFYGKQSKKRRENSHTQSDAKTNSQPCFLYAFFFKMYSFKHDSLSVYRLSRNKFYIQTSRTSTSTGSF